MTVSVSQVRTPIRVVGTEESGERVREMGEWEGKSLYDGSKGDSQACTSSHKKYRVEKSQVLYLKIRSPNTQRFVYFFLDFDEILVTRMRFFSCNNRILFDLIRFLLI